ncbi:histidine phosphatase family protein [Clostridium sp. SHJSY1]|uniref:histidine phosphatase family protein n=1 Tax=Clostridium sp. SHJSY1 TaxID=2942483 RepID=UPI0028742534|nr:histidine phosphatase family protein [Clostridium sp. SHJSY1]MDS0526565.1 histidine phosphatase family protein [Clostridium sp. SHJSY1]
MIKIILIRHSKTQGNLYKRYIGKTDEELSLEGIEIIKSKEFPAVQVVYSSPMKRCVETSKLIYKDMNSIIYDDLSECDFGDFENKNYEDLKDDIYYQKWIDSNGTIAFPKGEKHETFKLRCVRAFDEVVDNITESKFNLAAMVVHGGTIMAILEKYSYPHKDFYNWQVENCCGYLIEINEELWISGEKKVKVVSEI